MAKKTKASQLLSLGLASHLHSGRLRLGGETVCRVFRLPSCGRGSRVCHQELEVKHFSWQVRIMTVLTSKGTG